MRSKLTRRPSEMTRKIGKAQLLYEQMVRKAERTLSELERKSNDGVQSEEAMAEELAEELFHKPGSLLSREEIAYIWEQSGCGAVRITPRCNFPEVSQFRTIDSTCNNLENPLFGASGTPFTRILPAEYEDGISSLRGSLQAQSDGFIGGPFAAPVPSARSISSTVVKSDADHETYNHLFMQWGQFLDHDITMAPDQGENNTCHGCTFTDICQPIRVEELDKAFGVGTLRNASCLPFYRSVPACEITRPGQFLPRQQINDVTAYIDASVVYGSNENVGKAVRSMKDGLLKTGLNFPADKPTLPIDKQSITQCVNNKDCFLCGDIRCNDVITLTVVHTIWMREHNRIAKELKTLNPHWDDERIFQEARKIVGALMQKIAYDDYLPKLLGSEMFNRIIGPYTGYNSSVIAGIASGFTAAVGRFGHSLVRPRIDRLGPDYESLGSLPLVEAFFNPAQFKTSGGSDPILRGMVSDNSRRVDEFLNLALTTKLFQKKEHNIPGMDLASLNIQRGRDHGLPPYLTWKNFCQREFNITSEFEHPITHVRLIRDYGSLDTVDFWVGGLAEKRLPNSLLGATFACIFGITYKNLRDGDRFFYKNGIFSSEQLQQIENRTLSRMICDNSDNITEIQPDAFLAVGKDNHVSCQGFPPLNLSAWREQCYYRADIEPLKSKATISTLSRSTGNQNYIFSTNPVAASTKNPKNQSLCAFIQCPTRTRTTDIIASGKTTEMLLHIQPNHGLPPSKISSLDVYRGFWHIGSPGVYSSLKACENGAEVALTFTDTSEQPSSGSGEQDSVLEVLKQPNPTTVEDLIATSKTSANLQDTASVESEEQLLNDLANELKILEN